MDSRTRSFVAGSRRRRGCHVDMALDGAATFRRPCRFAAAELTDAALKAEIDARFPDFENNGWRLDAEYTAPMPEALRSDLAQFFAPHNELLFAWTGERLDWPAH